MRYYKINIGLTLLVLLGCLLGCSRMQVSQDYELSRDFSALKTYAWQTENRPKTGDVRIDNPLLDDRIRAAVDDSLAIKGYRKTERGTPDFLVAYTLQISRKIESSKVTFGFGFGSGGGGTYTGIGLDSGGRVAEFDEGLWVIDLIDPANDDLLWRGTGTMPVDQHTNPEKKVKEINAGVAKILSQFPPKTK